MNVPLLPSNPATSAAECEREDLSLKTWFSVLCAPRLGARLVICDVSETTANFNTLVKMSMLSLLSLLAVFTVTGKEMMILCDGS